MASAGRAARLLLLLLIALGASAATAAEIELRAEWTAAVAGADADSVRAGALDDAFVPFDPRRLQGIARNPHGAWVRLTPVAPVPADAELTLLVRSPGLERVVWFPPPGTPEQRSGFFHPQRNVPLLGGRLGFELESADAETPLLLYFEPQPALNAAVGFALRPRAEAANEAVLWLALAGACFGVMGAMAVVALVFALLLRDITFAVYAAYVLTYSMIYAIQTGFVAYPLGWDAVVAAPSAWGRGVTGASVLFACLFLSRFANLRRYAPTWRRWVLGLGFAVLTLMLMGWLPVPALQTLGPRLINPLLMLGAVVLLAASVTALARGSRYAGFFLIGWLPLLLLTAVGSAQHFGAFAGWTWAGDAAMVAGAFEALVLSLGLASRTLGVRRERDDARRLAALDPLTGLLNRRSFDERFAAMVERYDGTGIPVSVVFLDLDNFKQINDRYGHAAGDKLLREFAGRLRAEVRDEDLVGRYGGEEFVLALPRCGTERALEVTERLRRDLAERALAGGSEMPAVTLSAGVAQLQPGEAPHAVLARTDATMYRAKQGGRNRVELAPATVTSSH